MISFDSRPVRAYAGLLALGVLAGGMELALDLDDTSTGAGVATANWVHVGLAVAALAALATAWRRDRDRLAAFLRRPLTAPGWSAMLAALRWRGRPEPLRPLAFLGALLTLYSPLRAGEQVLAALDPDFTRDAWGGPGYLGASAAHWLDGALLFLAGSAVVQVAARQRVRAGQ